MDRIKIFSIFIFSSSIFITSCAVFLPNYTKNEEAKEDALISSIRAALDIYANESLMISGIKIWPDNPFSALSTLPSGYTEDGTNADSDNEWTYVEGDPNYITHQRSDNTRWKWEYDEGINTGTYADQTIGTLGSREEL